MTITSGDLLDNSTVLALAALSECEDGFSWVGLEGDILSIALLSSGAPNIFFILSAVNSDVPEK